MHMVVTHMLKSQYYEDQIVTLFAINPKHLHLN